MFQIFRNYYEDYRKWSTDIKIDTPISEIKNSVPDYIEVDWDNPQNFGNGFWYSVVKIKGHRFKNTREFLGFVDDLYCGPIFTKV